MADAFEQWLQDTEMQLEEVKAGIGLITAELSRTRDEFLQLKQDASDATSRSSKLSGASGGLLAAHNTLRDSIRRFALLTHTIEVAFATEYLFARAGIDFSQLVPPQVIEYSGGNRLIAEQSSPGRLVLANASSCHAIGLDQLGLDVPMRLELLGNEKRFDLNLVIQPSISVSEQSVMLRQARLPGVCPPDAVNQTLRLSLVARAFMEVARQLTTTLTPPSGLDMGLGRPVYTSACVYDSLRLFGIINRRSRAIVPQLTTMPSWADAALKLGSSELVKKVSGMMQQYGADLVDGPHFNAANRFEVTGQITASTGIKIGCVEYRATIRVRVKLDCHVSVQLVNEIAFRATQIGSPDVDVDFNPRVVPGIRDLVQSILADIIQGKIPNIKLYEKFPLSLATRLEVVLDATSLTAFMNLRH